MSNLLYRNNIYVNSSSSMCIYMISGVHVARLGDYIIAYDGDEVVGAQAWGGEITGLVAMGKDGTELTSEYSDMGNILTFKLLKKSGRFINLYGDVPPFQQLQFHFINLSPLNKTKKIRKK